MRGVLEELGTRLQEAGCGGVGVSARELEVRWTALHRRVEQKRISTDRNRKLGIG